MDPIENSSQSSHYTFRHVGESRVSSPSIKKNNTFEKKMINYTLKLRLKIYTNVKEQSVAKTQRQYQRRAGGEGGNQNKKKMPGHIYSNNLNLIPGQRVIIRCNRLKQEDRTHNKQRRNIIIFKTTTGMGADKIKIFPPGNPQHSSIRPTHDAEGIQNQTTQQNVQCTERKDRGRLWE